MDEPTRLLRIPRQRDPRGHSDDRGDLVAPVGSAARADGERAQQADRSRLDPALRTGLRRLGAIVFVLPLVLLVLVHLPGWPRDPILMSYGIGVLASTIAIFYLAYKRYVDPSDPVILMTRRVARTTFPALPARPRVSFVVAVMNEIDVIERCLRSMIASDYSNLEIIVVDDASTDGTAELLERLTHELDFTLVALEHNRGKKHALVEGVKMSTGEVFAFTDSDCVLAPDALRRCVAALLIDPELGAVSGHARALNADASFVSKIQDSWYEGSFRITKAAESSLGSVTCVSGPLAVFRRDAIFNYLPAWANDRFLGAEFKFATDRQLTGYVLGQVWKGPALKSRYSDSPFVTSEDHPERRWRVGYVRSARVWTVVPETYSAFLKQQVRWKKSFIRNLCFTGTFIWRRGAGPGLLYSAHALWVLSAPLMAVRHLVWGPLNGMWMLTALYLGGVVLKGCFWGLSYALDHPNSTRWIYRPAMSLVSSVLLSWLLPYSLLTIRRGVWSRGKA
jgi:cellulose synthase/poly-beta-1,6-N-acetylglucosamine synthase-like glycosyltransferase